MLLWCANCALLARSTLRLLCTVFCPNKSRCRLRLNCDGTRAETIFRLSAKRTSPFKSAEASVQSSTGSRGVRTSGSNAGYTMFRGSVKSTGYPLHSPVPPSLPHPCVTVFHQISTGLYRYIAETNVLVYSPARLIVPVTLTLCPACLHVSCLIA